MAFSQAFVVQKAIEWPGGWARFSHPDFDVSAALTNKT